MAEIDTAERFSVAEVVADVLRAHGIQRVFGLPGGEVLSLLDAFRRGGIDFVVCRHEASAGVIAASYGRLSNQPGVVVATVGPGAVNTFAAVASSLLEHDPLLAIVAQVPDELPSTHTHQRLPLHDVFRSVTKFTAAVERHTCWEVIGGALELCIAAPAGPVLLTLSSTEAQQDVGWKQLEHPSLARGDSVCPVPDAPSTTPQEAGKEILRRLIAAKHPLVIVGAQTRSQNVAQLRRWLQTTKIPFGVTPKAKGLVDEEADAFLGVFGGMAADYVMRRATEVADCVLGFGLDPVELNRPWHIDAPILWIWEESSTPDIRPSPLIVTSHSKLLDYLLSVRLICSMSPPLRAVQRKRQSTWEGLSSEDGAERPTPTAVLRALRTAAPQDAILVTDVGAHKLLFGQFWRTSLPNTFLTPNGLSAMGYSIPAAIGAKLANPTRTVIAVCGDGGFLMSSHELETARRRGIAIAIVLLVDGSYSLIRVQQQRQGLARFGVDFGPVDYAALAHALGAIVVRVGAVDELQDAVGEIVRRDQVAVLEVQIDGKSYEELV